MWHNVGMSPTLCQVELLAGVLSRLAWQVQEYLEVSMDWNLLTQSPCGSGNPWVDEEGQIQDLGSHRIL